MAVSRIGTLGITLFLLSLNFGLAQGVKTISWKDLNRKDGVYYSLENFLNNQPDIPRDALLDDEHLIILGQWVGSPFNIFYTEIGFMNRYGVKEKIATKMIWAIVQNGYPQIVDQQMRTFSEQRSIYPLKTPGYFMRYTIYNFALPKAGQNVNTKLKKPSEDHFAIDVRTGAVYSLSADWKEISAIIKRAPSFRAAKIKKKNIDSYIYEYNKLFPIGEFYKN